MKAYRWIVLLVFLFFTVLLSVSCVVPETPDEQPDVTFVYSGNTITDVIISDKLLSSGEPIHVMFPTQTPEGEDITGVRLSFHHIPSLIREDDFEQNIKIPVERLVEEKRITEEESAAFLERFVFLDSLADVGAFRETIWHYIYPILEETKGTNWYFFGAENHSDEELRGTIVLLRTIGYDALQSYRTTREVVGDRYSRELAVLPYDSDITFVFPDTMVDLELKTPLLGDMAEWENGIAYIDDWAVAYNEDANMGALVLREGTVGLMNGLFKGCESLTSLTLPDSVRTIGKYAFLNCSNLEGITIGKGISDVFSGGYKDFKFITVPETHETYRSIDGNLYSKDGEKMLWYASGREEAAFVVPDGVRELAERVFSGCAHLESITLPDSLEIIGYRAFSDCTRLSKLAIPDNVYNIRDEAFLGCESLTDVVLPERITFLGKKIFYRCMGLKSVTFLGNVSKLEGVFDGCENLTSIVLGDVMEYACYYTVFENCPNLVYNEYDGALYLGTVDNPYAYLVKAKSNDIVSCEIHADTKSISEYAFQDCIGLVNIVIPDGVKTICSGAFSGCTSLGSVHIPSSMGSIGDDAFSGCVSLQSVNIPDSVWHVGDDAFEGCDGVTQVENGVSYVDKWVVDCDIGAVYASLRKDTFGIAAWAFKKCNALSDIVIPVSVRQIDASAFPYGMGLENVYYEGTHEEWDAIDIGWGNESITKEIKRYAYSAEEPTDSRYRYWRYVDGVPTPW